ncbi:exo-alpha-sialidase [Gemmatimonas sp.]|uniref:WD40/YVTN/BNR-like repeat-containing protein n=1 Tax=Gemmatimonas sp. TaxID=1962908 RepID=UPI0025BE306D|nr:exo-alpha-sialidase [Gemmatimonas sp.]MCA2995959.1 glycosyl hydrolase [Gemmatimonas sp.]
MLPNRSLRGGLRAICATIVASAALVPAGVEAQSSARPGAAAGGTRPAYDPTLYSDGSRTARAFKSLRWRLVGPFRGGRSTAVTGDPTRPLVFYFGAVNGGVWKTTNAGQTWENITDGKTDLSSVGAITVAPSDPNVIWVGSGEGKPREDITYGTGVYRSTDGGESWVPRGLANTHQITSLRVHPTNPDVAYVTALGHAFGPNPDRGVFRTTDGGATWKKILFVDDSTGAADLSMDVTNPRILYASLWKFQRTPWGMNAGAGRSGLWKSTDGGDTWTELTFNPGMPKGLIGKIGVAVSPANGQRVYANIEAQDSLGGVFRSDDGGASWTRTNGDQKFVVRPFYYMSITADPVNENTVYVMNLQVSRSIDGGRTFSTVRVPHGDTHIMWVDPKNPQRLINGNDGGATVSLDGGRTWSTQNNQPTSQFYHVTTDQSQPYRILGAQQDNTTVNIAHRSDRGSLTERDWYPVAGCENAYIAIDPRDPNVTFGGCYMGQLSRHDARTNMRRDVSVWLGNYDGYAVADVPQRFQWTFPIHFSPHDPDVLYTASQYVWRSRNQGSSWEKISGDLTRHDPATMQRSGGPVTGDMTGTEWYATIFAFAESPVTKGVLWTGSDDGLVHVSRDNGATWTNVTPKAFGAFTRVSIIEASPFEAGTAYLAANRYQQDDFTPYLFKTTDYGASWTRIDAGIPQGAFTRAIRSDTKRKGLLFAGTETGVYVSLNDGTSWEPLQLNLPRVVIRDLRVHGNDLIVATHGRSFWSLDDISPLRTLGETITAKPVHLFAPAPAIRWVSGGGSGRASLTAGGNPRFGVNIDYWLKAAPSAPISLQILEAGGTVVHTFRSASAPRKDSTGNPAADSAASLVRVKQRAEALAYEPADSVVQARAGANRFTWDLAYPGPRTIPGAIIDDGTTDGPTAVPGEYAVRLIVGTDTLSQPFTVLADPRVSLTAAEYKAQFDAANAVGARITNITETVARIQDLQRQLDERARQVGSQAYAAEVRAASTALRRKLEAVRAEIYEVYTKADQATLNYPIKLYQMFISLNSQVLEGTNPPTKQHGEITSDLGGKLDVQLRTLQGLEDKELSDFNALLSRLGVPNVFVPKKPIG